MDQVITRKLRALKGPQVRTITRYGTGERNKPLTERVEVRQYARRLLTSFREAASSVPYRQAHKQRPLCCSLCLTE